MNDHENAIADVLDEAVEILTRIAHLTAQTSHPTGTDVRFAGRLVDTLTHVAANVRGVDRGHKVDGPVAILQGERTASSAEVVLAAFRGLDRVATFGAPSAGYTSANTPYRLYDGAQLVVIESIYVDRDGTALDEQPLPADHPASKTAARSAARHLPPGLCASSW